MVADGVQPPLNIRPRSADSHCMRLPWKSKTQAEPEPPPERRQEPEWCATCRSPFGPFVYLESGRHYCEPCAEQIQRTMGLKVAERRDGDHLHS